MYNNNFTPPKYFGLQWHITERCNWHCQHCYQGEYPCPDLDLKQLFHIFDQFLSLIKKWQISSQRAYLTLTGGEPFLRKDFFQLLKKVGKHSHLYRWSILSNGSLITKEILKKLKEFNIYQFQVSLEGMEENNDRVRGKGAFKKTIEAIKLLREADIPTLVSFTLTKKNINDVVPLAGLLDQLGVARLGTRRLVPWGRGKELEEYMIQPEELKDYYFKIKEINQKLAKERKKFRVLIGCEGAIFNEEMLTDSSPAMKTPLCGVTLGGQLNVMANGDILPCRRFSLVVGNALKDKFEDVYYSKQMRDLRDINKLHPFCRNCSNFSDCLGGAKCVTYAYSGQRNFPDVQCWRAYQKLGDAPPAPQMVEKKDKNYTLNEYFSFPLDADNVLLTTRHKGWAILNKEDYQQVQLDNLSGQPELFRNLERVGIVLSPRNIKEVTSLLCRQNNFLFHHPSCHVISVTNKCNLNCLYCHFEHNQKSEKKEMDEKTAEKILDFIFSIPMESCEIIIEGGETLLKWDLIKKLYLEAKQRADKKKLRLKFAFGTNANLMTEKIAEDIVKLGLLPCISFDGPKEVHDSQRITIQGRGSYDKALYWIKRLKKKGVLINVLPVITKLSLKVGPKAIIDEYIKIGQKTIFLKPLRLTGNAALNSEKLAMTPEEFFNFWREGIEYCISLNKKGIKIQDETASHFLVHLLYSPVPSSRDSMCKRHPCGAGFSILSYAPDGTITGCDCAREMGFLDLGHVNRDNYPAIRSRIIPLLDLAPDLLPICSSCPFMPFCGICLTSVWEQEKDFYPKISRNFECQWQKMALPYLFKKFLEQGEDAEILRTWR